MAVTQILEIYALHAVMTAKRVKVAHQLAYPVQTQLSSTVQHKPACLQQVAHSELTQTRTQTNA